MLVDCLPDANLECILLLRFKRVHTFPSVEQRGQQRGLPHVSPSSLLR